MIKIFGIVKWNFPNKDAESWFCFYRIKVYKDQSFLCISVQHQFQYKILDTKWERNFIHYFVLVSEQFDQFFVKSLSKSESAS